MQPVCGTHAGKVEYVLYNKHSVEVWNYTWREKLKGKARRMTPPLRRGKALAPSGVRSVRQSHLLFVDCAGRVSRGASLLLRKPHRRKVPWPTFRGASASWGKKKQSWQIKRNKRLNGILMSLSAGLLMTRLLCTEPASVHMEEHITRVSDYSRKERRDDSHQICQKFP